MNIYYRSYHIIIIILLLILNIFNKPATAASDYYSYCNTFGITCPQQLDPKLINTNIAHRFYGPISDGADTFWGLDNGANIMLYLSTTLTKVDKIHIQRISVDKDIQIGYQRSAQVLALPLFVMAQINGNWYNDNNSDVFNGFSVVGVTWDYKFGQLHTNIGYDHYEEDLGAGSAVVLSVNSDWDMVLEGYTTSQGNDNALSVGIVYHTFGHRFKLGIHNSANIGFRQLMQGATNKDWVLGFQIHRLLEW